MIQPQFIRRTFPIGALGAAFALCTGSAAAAESKGERVCQATYKSAQAQEQSGRLAEAKDLYAACAKTACGTFLAHACTARFTQLDTETPSIVPVVTDASGAPRADVEVKMDGVTLTSRLDGRALNVSPGMHEFTFLSNNQVFATEQLMIAMGQRNRTVAVTMNGSSARAAKRSEVAAVAAPRAQAKPAPVLQSKVEATETKQVIEEAPEPAPEPTGTASTGGRSLVLPMVLGGVGVLGLAGFGTLVAWGRKDNDMLGQCSPDCSPDAVSHIRKLYIGADISLGVGIVALGTATYLLLKPHSKEDAQTQSAFTVNVQPTRAGGFASVAGAF